jgi:hypothetical protein
MPRIVRLVGVYDADSTLRGELSYWIGARLGRAHCSLCDITHGLVRERAEWKQCRQDLPVPFDTYHRDDQPSAVRAASGDAAPVVMAETDAGLVTLLDGVALENLDGSPERLIAAVKLAMADASLTVA